MFGGGLTLIMWYIIPETYGLANTYCLSFSIGVIYAELAKDKIISVKLYRIIQLLMFIILLIGGWIILYHSNESGILFGRKINFFIYTLFTNIVFACGALLLCYTCGKLGDICRLLQRNAALLGRMSLMIYYLQQPLVVNPIDWVDGILWKICVMLIGVIVVFFAAYIYACHGFKNRYRKNLLHERGN